MDDSQLTGIHTHNKIFCSFYKKFIKIIINRHQLRDTNKNLYVASYNNNLDKILGSKIKYFTEKKKKLHKEFCQDVWTICSM